MAKPISSQMRALQAKLLKQKQAVASAQAKLNQARSGARANKRQSDAKLAKTVAERAAARRQTTKANKATSAEKEGRSNDRFVGSVVASTTGSIAGLGVAAGYKKYNEVKKKNESLTADLNKARAPSINSPSPSQMNSSWWADRKKQGRGY